MDNLQGVENIRLEFKTLQQIGEVSTEGIFIYDLQDNQIIYANSNVYRLAGLNEYSTHLDIESIFDRVIPQDRESLRKQYVSITEKHITGDVEFELTDTNGQRMFVSCNAFLVADKSAIVVFIKDITNAKKHYDYLVEYGTRKNTILDMLAHHMTGALKLMQHLSGEAGKYIDVSNDKNLKIYMNLLNDNSSHSLQIIHDLLKNEHATSVSTRNKRIDIVEKISSIHTMLTQSYQTREFIFQTSTESLFITTDEVKLLQVVNNFTSNAMKFSAFEKIIVIGISETATHVTVSVKDSGIGIPETLKPLIFQTQFGTGRLGLNGEHSIGLGLSISNNLIQQMDGKIGFESYEGEGSTFYFSLPKE